MSNEKEEEEIVIYCKNEKCKAPIRIKQEYFNQMHTIRCPDCGKKNYVHK